MPQSNILTHAFAYLRVKWLKRHVCLIFIKAPRQQFGSFLRFSQVAKLKKSTRRSTHQKTYQLVFGMNLAGKFNVWLRDPGNEVTSKKGISREEWTQRGAW